MKSPWFWTTSGCWPDVTMLVSLVSVNWLSWMSVEPPVSMVSGPGHDPLAGGLWLRWHLTPRVLPKIWLAPNPPLEPAMSIAALPLMPVNVESRTMVPVVDRLRIGLLSFWKLRLANVNPVWPLAKKQFDVSEL